MTLLARKLMNSSASFPTATYITSDSLTTNVTSYNHGTLSIGTASSDRLVVVVVTGQHGSSSVERTISSVSIAGSNGTIHNQLAESEGAGGNHNNYAIASRLVTTGTTGNITVVFSSAMTGCTVHIFTLTGYTSATPAATYSSSDADPINLVLGSHPSGVAIGGAISLNGTEVTFSSTGSVQPSEYGEVSAGNRRRAGFILTDASGSPTLSCAFGSSNVDEVFGCAVWE